MTLHLYFFNSENTVYSKTPCFLECICIARSGAVFLCHGCKELLVDVNGYVIPIKVILSIACVDISEFPTDFVKLDALTILSIQTVLQDFVPQLSGLVLRDPHSAGEGVAMVGKFAART